MELQQLLAGLSEEHVPRVASHLAPFTDLLTTFLEDTNFKIALTSLQMISDLLDRFGEHIRNGPDSERIFLAIVPRLMDKFADNKIVIRQANFRLTKKLFAIVPPERALPSLLGYAQHANSHIREQAISVLIQTLLTAPRQSLDVYANAMMALAQPLSDSKPKVRQVALEATAVIFETAGASAFESLLRDADLDEEIEHRITERIRQGKSALPTVSSDGLVEFTTQPGLAPRDGGGSGGGAAPPRVPSAGLSGPLAARPLGGARPQRHRRWRRRRRLWWRGRRRRLAAYARRANAGGAPTFAHGEWRLVFGGLVGFNDARWSRRGGTGATRLFGSDGVHRGRAQDCDEQGAAPVGYARPRWRRTRGRRVARQGRAFDCTATA